MKRTRFPILVGATFLTLVLLVSACASPASEPASKPASEPASKAASKPAASTPITLKAIHFVPPTSPAAWGHNLFIAKVNEAAKGELIIEDAGGPAAIPAFEQFEAVRTGIVAIGSLGATYHEEIIPENMTLRVSRITPQEERKTGYYKYLADLYEKQDMYSLGRELINNPYSMGSNIRATTPKQLQGAKFRTVGIYEPIFKKLGIAGVTMPPTDAYNALQTNLIQGAIVPLTSHVGYKHYEVMKYIVGPAFFPAGDIWRTVNKDAWNKLPKHLQDLLVETQDKVEIEVALHYKTEFEAAKKTMQDKGVEFVEWSAEDTKWFLRDAVEAPVWEVLESKRGPEVAKKMKSMVGY